MTDTNPAEANTATKNREKQMLKSSHRRFLGALALAVGLVGLAVPVASAETDLGDLFTPASGTANDYINLDTHAPCPAGTANVKVSLNGTGINDISANNLNGLTPYSSVITNSSGGFSIQTANTLKDIFQAYAVISPSGHYVINLRCQNSDGSVVYGDFLATINLTPSGTAFEGGYTYVAPVGNGVATSTALSVNVPDPVTTTTAVALTATLTPSSAVGKVQFKRGTTNIGSPVTVSSGTATLSGVLLPAGTQSLTAVFTPTSTDAFLASTSAARSYVVAGVPSITGTVRVASKVTCSSSTATGATKAYSWIVGTTTSSLTTSSVTISSSWAKKSLKCVVKTTKNAKTVTTTSAAKTVALGLAPVATTKPSIKGTLHVGYTLTCSRGTWSPTPTSYKYQWYRGTTALSGKIYSTYKVSSYDKGKYLSCKVTALKTGYTSGVAKSAAKKIT